jgi:hypothetical protein
MLSSNWLHQKVSTAISCEIYPQLILLYKFFTWVFPFKFMWYAK